MLNQRAYAIICCILVVQTFFYGEVHAQMGNFAPLAFRKLGDSHFIPRGGGSISRDGRWLASQGYGDIHLIDIYDLTEGRRVSTLCNPVGWAHQFSSDATQILCDSHDTDIDVIKVVIIDLFTRSQLKEIEFQHATAVTMSPDNRWLAVAKNENEVDTVEIWEWLTNKMVHAEKLDLKQGVKWLKFSADGSRFGVATDHGFQLFCSKEGRLEPIYSDQDGEIMHNFIGFSDDLKQCLFYQVCEAVEVIDSSDGTSLLKIPATCNSKAAFVRGDREVAIAGRTGRLEIEFFDIATGTPSGVMSGHSENLDGLISAPAGTNLVGYSENAAWVWDTQSLTLRDYCRKLNEIAEIHFSPNGKVLACNSKSTEVYASDEDVCQGPISHWVCPQGVQFWNHETGQSLERFDNWKCAGFNSDSTLGLLWNHRGKISVVDLSTMKIVEAAKLYYSDEGKLLVEKEGLEQHESNVCQLIDLQCAAAMSSQMALGALCQSRDEFRPAIHAIRLDWDHDLVKTSMRAQLKESERHAQLLTNAISGDGSAVTFLFGWNGPYAGLPCGQISFMKNDGAQTVRWIELEDTDFFRPVLNSDGRIVASLCHHHDDSSFKLDSIGLWSTATGTLIRQIPLNRLDTSENWRSACELVKHSCIAISPDNEFVAVENYFGRVQIWKTAGGHDAPVLTLAGHAAEVTSISFSPDGRWLATGSSDSTVLTYDLRKLLPK